MPKPDMHGAGCCACGGTTCTTAATITYGATGCLNLAGIVVQVEDPTGVIVATHSASGSPSSPGLNVTSTATYSATVAGVYTIRIVAYPSRYAAPSSLTILRTVVCGGTYSAVFGLVPAPGYTCCYPDRTTPLPSTLTVSDGISTATLTATSGAPGLYRGALPLLNVPVGDCFSGSPFPWLDGGLGDSIMAIILDLRGGTCGCAGFGATIPMTSSSAWAIPVGALTVVGGVYTNNTPCADYIGAVASCGFSFATGVATSVVDLVGTVTLGSCTPPPPIVGSPDGVTVPPGRILCAAYGGSFDLHFTG